MRESICVFVLSFLANVLLAQPDTLLKKYKFRVDNYSGASFNANGDNEINRSEAPLGTAKTNTYSGVLGGSYFITRSTDKILLSAFASLGNRLYSAKYKNPGSSKNTSLSITPSFSILNKWFTKKIFTELGAEATGTFNNNKNTTSTNPTPAKNKAIRYNIAFNLGVGTGRLENITDMQNALWLYKALVESGRLSRNLTADELYDLGKSITKGNNTRVLDSRKSIQFLLTTVDDYLQQKGLINKTDITYFSNLNDILFFAYNNQRLSGTEKFIRFRPEIARYNKNQFPGNGTDKFTENQMVNGIGMSLGVNRHIASSLVHQNIYSVAAKASYLSGDFTNSSYFNGNIVSEIKRKNSIRQIGGNLFYEHDIYPNTRTEFVFTFETNFGYQDINRANFYCISNLYGGINYFLSYRTRLLFGVSGYYQKNASNIYSGVNPNADFFRAFVFAGIDINL